MAGLMDLRPLNPFGSWTALECVGRRMGQTYWKCRCKCGTEREIAAGNLRSGASLGCEKCKNERFQPANMKHGGSKTREYKNWSNYKRRGVLCDAWMDFAVFRKDVGKMPPRARLYRQDFSEQLGPGNCSLEEIGVLSEQDKQELGSMTGIFRRAKMIECRAKGAKLQEIAICAGITRERVRQLASWRRCMSELTKRYNMQESLAIKTQENDDNIAILKALLAKVDPMYIGTTSELGDRVRKSKKPKEIAIAEPAGS